MFGFLALLAANTIGIVVLCLYMLYAVVIILFVVCTFMGALGMLAIRDCLRPVRLQV